MESLNKRAIASLVRSRPSVAYTSIYGSLAKDDKRRLGADTVFEIGSITKVFTSLVLMDMVRRGELR